jgi:hypothetical protein
MSKDDVVRRALWATVVFNVVGALLFAFPDTLGRFANLPGGVPRLYAFSMALMVALFAGAYAFLARQPSIDRPMVGFLAIGKASFFTLTVLCWLAGEASGMVVLAASGDLVFAAIFAWWLLGTAGVQPA